MKGRIIGICMASMILWFFFASHVDAAEMEGVQKQAEERLFEEFAFEEMDAFLDDIFPKQRVSFMELLTKIMSGEQALSLDGIGEMITGQLFYELKNSKKGMMHILLIAVIAAVFTNFSNVFQNKQISEISFYVLYLFFITISLNAFRILVASAGVHLEHLLTFMKLLGPIYFLALAFATGGSTSVMFYNLILFFIYLVEVLILNFLIPLVQVFMIIKIINHLSEEDYLSKFAEFLETVIVWTLKTLLAAVVGLNLIQGLLSPAIDSLKRSIVTEGAEAIPLVGDALGGTAEIVLGTAVLIKNGIGITGMVICIVICLIPFVQMAVVTLLYKLIAALIQPVSDKRMVGCISSIAQGSQLLLRVIFTSGVLFLLTIAIVTTTTML